MPSNLDFTLRALVGGSVLPEYEKDGKYYVECNLFTPYSFQQRSEEQVDGETEVQKWPVTPFTLCIHASPLTPHCYYRIYIDGQKVASKSILPGERKDIKGFKDGNAVREFLFSLPRFAINEDDRVTEDHESRIGCIEVECYNGQLRHTRSAIRSRQLSFEQANKKDCGKVTKGKYLMATTKAGRVVSLKQVYRTTDYWDVTSLRSKLCIRYVTADTLTEMGLSVIPIPFPVNTVNILSTQNSYTSGRSSVRSQGHRKRSRVKREPDSVVLSPDGVDLSQGLAGSVYDESESSVNNIDSDPTVAVIGESPQQQRMPAILDHSYTNQQTVQPGLEDTSVQDVPEVKEEVELSSLSEDILIDLTEHNEEKPKLVSGEVIIID